LNGLENLLLLDGEIFPMDNGYWVKFEVKQTVTNENIPHGIRYSLTLHDKHNQRVIGYDNAHSFRPTTVGFRARRVTWDHIHKKDAVVEYDFDSADKLMEDFWQSANTYMDNH
jgi:hypothetical protein